MVKNLNLNVTDAGLSDIILTSVAAEQGADAATMRPIFAGLAEGTVIGMLAGAAEAQKVGSAINAFVAGKAKSLNIVADRQGGSGPRHDGLHGRRTGPDGADRQGQYRRHRQVKNTGPPFGVALLFLAQLGLRSPQGPS